MTGWVTRECLAAVAELAIDPPVTVAMEQSEVPAALREGRVDAAATFADVVPHLRSSAGIDLRAMPVGPQVYATGLVANDGVSDGVVERLREALAQAFQRQRDNPEFGVEQFCRRFPEIPPSQAREGWEILEPYAFAGGRVGWMDKERWETTVEWLSDVHSFAPTPSESVYRPQFARAKSVDASAGS